MVSGARLATNQREGPRSSVGEPGGRRVQDFPRLFANELVQCHHGRWFSTRFCWEQREGWSGRGPAGLSSKLFPQKIRSASRTFLGRVRLRLPENRKGLPELAQASQQFRFFRPQLAKCYPLPILHNSEFMGTGAASHHAGEIRPLIKGPGLYQLRFAACRPYPRT